MTPATLDLLGASERVRARGDRTRTAGDRSRERGDRATPLRDPSALRPPAADAEVTPPTPGHATHHEPTLDEFLSSTWDTLTSHQPATCPVCTGTMAPRYGSGALPVGGRCRRCGTSLG